MRAAQSSSDPRDGEEITEEPPQRKSPECHEHPLLDPLPLVAAFFLAVQPRPRLDAVMTGLTNAERAPILPGRKHPNPVQVDGIVERRGLDEEAKFLGGFEFLRAKLTTT
jgi:hypothetical protein